MYNTKFHSHLGVKGRELEKPMIVLAFGRADFEFNGANTFFSHFFRGPLYRDATIVEAGDVAGRL